MEMNAIRDCDRDGRGSDAAGSDLRRDTFLFRFLPIGPCEAQARRNEGALAWVGRSGEAVSRKGER
jgi:hypothetical protein